MRTSVPLLVAASACLLLTSCSSSDDPAAEASTTPSAVPTTASASATKGAAASPGATAAPSASGAAATGAPVATTSASPAASRATSVTGTAPGDYTYDSSGTYSLGGPPQKANGTATLTVTPLRGDRQTSTLHSEQGGDTVQELVIRSGGVHLARLSIGTPVNKEFRPPSPVLLFPTPAAVGRSWSWQATSTDGSSTVSTTNKVLRNETLTIGGERVATVVLQSRLVIKGDVSYTADVTTWVATAYRLPVKDHTKGSGKWGTLSFSTDVTNTLRSARPA